MAWIESHQELGRHPKTRKLARLLNISQVCVVGHLHFLWWWAMDYAQDGDLGRYDAQEIADAAMWEDDAGAFFDALVSVGFIDVSDSGGRELHDWYDCAGKLIEKRAENAERMRAARAAKSGARDGDIHSTSTPRATHVQRTFTARAGATKPNQTEPNHTEIHASPPDNITPFKPAAPEAAPEAASAAPVAAAAKPSASKRTPKYSGEEQAYVSALLKGVKEQTSIKGALPTEGKERDAAHWFYRAHDGEPAPVADVLDCYRATKAQDFWQGKYLSLQKLEACYTEYRRAPAAYKTPRASPSAQRNGHAPPPLRPQAGMDATQVPSAFARASPTPATA